MNLRKDPKKDVPYTPIDTTLEGDTSGSTWCTPSTDASFNSVVLALQQELGRKATHENAAELFEAVQQAGHHEMLGTARDVMRRQGYEESSLDARAARALHIIEEHASYALTEADTTVATSHDSHRPSPPTDAPVRPRPVLPSHAQQSPSPPAPRAHAAASLPRSRAGTTLPATPPTPDVYNISPVGPWSSSQRPAAPLSSEPTPSRPATQMMRPIGTDIFPSRVMGPSQGMMPTPLSGPTLGMLSDPQAPWAQSTHAPSEPLAATAISGAPSNMPISTVHTGSFAPHWMEGAPFGSPQGPVAQSVTNRAGKSDGHSTGNSKSCRSRSPTRRGQSSPQGERRPRHPRNSGEQTLGRKFGRKHSMLQGQADPDYTNRNVAEYWKDPEWRAARTEKARDVDYDQPPHRAHRLRTDEDGIATRLGQIVSWTLQHDTVKLRGTNMEVQRAIDWLDEEMRQLELQEDSSRRGKERTHWQAGPNAVSCQICGSPYQAGIDPLPGMLDTQGRWTCNRCHQLLQTSIVDQSNRSLHSLGAAYSSPAETDRATVERQQLRQALSASKVTAVQRETLREVAG